MSQEKQGKLKIFLGYAAGVGKTYSMLEAARVRQSEGVDVVIALAVTHGRKETEKLLVGLEVLPTREITYHGAAFQEIDLNGILARRPELVIVDELAHSNIPGSRHIKRYMDVEELLAAGIDVYTTLNIQHLESFQDSIEQATGVSVRERVPDRILDTASEIELIDLPPEELLERLRQGKVYVPDQAARAIHKFFRIENLQILREIALRKTAAIVDSDRVKRHHVTTYGVAPKLLASIGPSPFSERVVRLTKRLADMLQAEWLVVSVETPEMELRSLDEKNQVRKHLKLAEELGAKVITLPGESIADTIFTYAKANRVTQIVLGHSLRSWWQRFWYKSPVDELVRKDGAIDIYVISSGKNEATERNESVWAKVEKEHHPRKIAKDIFLPLGLVGLLTAVVTPLCECFSSTLLAISYFFSVFLAAIFLKPCSFYVYVAAAIISLDVVCTDLRNWFLEGDLFLFSVAIFFIGGMVNYLTTKNRRLVAAAVSHHQEVFRLFDLSRDLAAALGPAVMLARLNQHIKTVIQAEAILYFIEDKTYKQIGSVDSPFDMTEKMAAEWAIDHQEAAGFETDTLPSAKGLWIPLTVARRRVGSLGIYSKGLSLIEHRPLLEAFAHLMALSLDRGEN